MAQCFRLLVSGAESAQGESAFVQYSEGAQRCGGHSLGARGPRAEPAYHRTGTAVTNGYADTTLDAL